MKEFRPFFSIIVPTYNRPKQLKACLRSLVNQTYPKNSYQVIIVDDGGEMFLDENIAHFRKQINLSFYKQNNRGPAAARNMGAKHAKGDFLTFTDDDCTPASDWLFSLAVRFALSPKCFITGRTVNNLPNNLFAAVSQCLIEYLYSFFNTIPEQAQFCTSNNMAIPTNCSRKLGKFDTTYTRAAGEDRELCDRWLYQGGLILYAPEVVVYHAHSLTLLTFWQQHFGYGRASFHFHKMQAKRNNNLLRIESKRFYYNLLLSV